jgi:OOP family OmpA-OmpF porin
VGGGGVAAKPVTGALAAVGSIGAVLFAEAGTRLDANAKAVIAAAVKDVRARHAHLVTVVGYTDKIGNPAANRALSLKRARRVAAAMRRRLKDRSVHFRIEARGETHPVAPNTTPGGRQLDRRVAIFIAH